MVCSLSLSNFVYPITGNDLARTDTGVENTRTHVKDLKSCQCGFFILTSIFEAAATPLFEKFSLLTLYSTVLTCCPPPYFYHNQFAQRVEFIMEVLYIPTREWKDAWRYCQTFGG